MLSKIRNCFRLSGQLLDQGPGWINKDRSRVSSNLMALCFRLVLAPKSNPGRPSGNSCLALIEPHFLLQSDSAIESHSAASDVLRELTETIGEKAPCQADSVRTAQENQTSIRPEKRARSTQLLNFSIQLQWLGFGLRLPINFRLSTAIKHLDCAPSSLSKQLSDP